MITDATVVPLPVEPVIPPVVAEKPKADEKPQTITQHAEQFGDKPQASRPRRDDDRARPEDVKGIDKQTKRFHEAGEKLGITREAGESNRAYNLRIQAELAERLVTQATPKPEAEAKTPPAPAIKTVQAATFDEKEPTLDDYKDDADPAAAYFRALARYEVRKDQFEAQQKQAKADNESGAAEFTKWWGERQTEHVERVKTHIEKNPADKAILDAAGDLPLSPILFAAITLHPKSQDLMLALAKDQNLADELFLLTEGKPIGDPTRNPLVSSVQRRLVAKIGSGSSGQAQERSPKPAWTPPPSPPPPARTQATATATPDSDKEKESGSLLAHARRYSPRD
jgi:hypothetical protein